MPDQLQLRGGTTTEHNSFTGVSKEVTVDTTKKTLVVHDGSTAGGTPLMKESGGNAASAVSIGTGGNNVINIDSSQKVGIGVAVPTFDSGGGLHLRGPSGGQTRLHMTTSGSGDAATDGFYIISLGAESGSASGEVMLMQSENKALRFGANNQEKMRIDGLGNVGIGTATIADDADHCKLAISGQSGTAAGILIFQDTSNNEDGMIFADNGSLFLAADRSNTTADSTIRFRVDGSSEKMRIDHVGRLLIGTASPLMNENGFNEIYVTGKSEGAGIHFSDANNNVQGGIFTSDNSNKMFIRTITNHPIVFRTNNADQMTLDNEGRLGIGTMSPNSLYANHLVVDTGTSDQSGITIKSGTNKDGMIAFADSTSGSARYAGYLNYDHNIDHLVIATASSGQLTIDNNGLVGLGLTPGSGQGRLQINGGLKIAGSAAASDTTSPYIFRTSGADNMVFSSGGVERMRITTDGHVGIGTSTPDLLGTTTTSTYLAVIETSGSRRGKLLLGDNQNVDTGGIGDIHFVGHYQNSGHKEMATIKAVARGGTSGQRGADLVFETKANGNSSMNERLRIGSDGRIAQRGGDLVIDTTYNGYGGLRIVDDTSGDYNVNFIAGRNQSATAFVFKRSGRTQGTSPWANSGSDVEHARITRGGICFGGDNAAVNTLDDYEEGTHTLTQTGAGGGVPLSNNVIRYTKIGNTVHVSGLVDVGASSGSSDVQISLPFTSAADTGSTRTRTVSALMHKFCDVDGNYINIVGYIGQNENYFRIYHVGDNKDWHQFVSGDFTANSAEIFFTFTYQAA